VAQSRALYDNRIEELSFAHRFVSVPFVTDPSSLTASPPTVALWNKPNGEFCCRKIG
jgi:hypothetical protein